MFPSNACCWAPITRIYSSNRPSTAHKSVVNKVIYVKWLYVTQRTSESEAILKSHWPVGFRKWQVQVYVKLHGFPVFQDGLSWELLQSYRDLRVWWEFRPGSSIWKISSKQKSGMLYAFRCDRFDTKPVVHNCFYGVYIGKGVSIQ